LIVAVCLLIFGVRWIRHHIVGTQEHPKVMVGPPKTKQ
jgi:uncharacterized membrane protein